MRWHFTLEHLQPIDVNDRCSASWLDQDYTKHFIDLAFDFSEMHVWVSSKRLTLGRVISRVDPVRKHSISTQVRSRFREHTGVLPEKLGRTVLLLCREAVGKIFYQTLNVLGVI